jgi:hypothetical protein
MHQLLHKSNRLVLQENWNLSKPDSHDAFYSARFTRPDAAVSSNLATASCAFTISKSPLPRHEDSHRYQSSVKPNALSQLESKKLRTLAYCIAFSSKLREIQNNHLTFIYHLFLVASFPRCFHVRLSNSDSF